MQLQYRDATHVQGSKGTHPPFGAGGGSADDGVVDEPNGDRPVHILRDLRAERIRAGVAA